MSARNMAKRTAAGTLALAVCLGGGAIALASAASADANFKFDTRIAGDDRYQTAIAASKAAFPTDGKTDNVILVNGYATVDGLTASYLAGVANAPILYVSDQGADAATKAEIKRLGAKNIWLVGGEKVIPTSVETAIKGDGYNVTRINGSDRYETAKLIAEAGAKIAGKQPSKVFVASGTSFADALAVSPIAYNKGYAIALTEKDSTSDFTKKELGQIGTDNKILVGGTAVVSDKVKADLSITTRVAGDDRAVTANLVSDWAKKSEGFNPANAILVGGTNGNGADSLVASALGGKSFSTLHFAGWDATATYFKDHSAELTGKGFVFGGKAAVSDGQVSTAQSAAQFVAAVAGYTVLSSTVGTNTFTYSDTKTQASVSVTYKTSDKFKVDGVAASYGVFQAALGAGDSISWTTDGSGVTTYSLVNATVAGGLVGSIDSTKIYIVDPVTGSPLANYVFAPTNAVYLLDGVSVSKNAFLADVSAGDKLTVTGGDGSTVDKTQTFSLQNQVIMGTVAPATAAYSAGGFKVKTAAGASLGDFDATVAGTAITVNGAAASLATLEARMTTGDAVTYSVKGGVPSITLVDAAQTSISGVFSSNSASTYTYYVGDTSGTIAATTAADWTFKVDGVTVTRTEFEAAATPGDMITFVPKDNSVNTVGSMSLTTGNLSGALASVDTSAKTANVLTSASTNGQNLKTITWSNAASVYAGNTTNKFFVNGSEVTSAAFDAQMLSVKNQADAGTITVVDNGTTTEWRVTAVANATKVTALTAPTAGSATTTLTLTFNRPVYLSGTAAADDFVITYDGSTAVGYVSASPTTLASASSTVTLTVSSYTPAASKVTSVRLSDTGAAKFMDANGKAAATGATAVTATS